MRDAQNWNDSFPVGTPVIWHKDGGIGGVETKTSGPAFDLPTDGTVVPLEDAWIRVPIDFVTPRTRPVCESGYEFLEDTSFLEDE